MKKLTVIALAAIGLAFTSPARADVPATPSLCQQGGALAACPSGVPSNVSASVADTYSHYNAAGQSVGGQVGNSSSVSSVGSANNDQSVAMPLNRAANSVAWTQQRSDNSVASSSGFSNNSVAGSPIGGSSSSVVH